MEERLRDHLIFIWDQFMARQWRHMPEGHTAQEFATAALDVLGYQDLQWVQVDDITNLLFLSRDKVQWVVEFLGDDGSSISIFRLSSTLELER